MVTIQNFTNHREGGRAQVLYTFSDGRTASRTIRGQNSEQEALAKAESLIPAEELRLQMSDAGEAVSKGVVGAYKSASVEQVSYVTLKTAYELDEHYSAYAMIKDVAPSLLSLGYTDEQYATAFSSTVEEVQNIKGYWNFLDANSAVIESYGNLVDVRSV